MTRINGTNGAEVGEKITHEGIFIKHDSVELALHYGELFGISPDKIHALLRKACDEDNYSRDYWNAHLGNHIFYFHLARIEVELRKAE